MPKESRHHFHLPCTMMRHAFPAEKKIPFPDLAVRRTVSFRYSPVLMRRSKCCEICFTMVGCTLETCRRQSGNSFAVSPLRKALKADLCSTQRACRPSPRSPHTSRGHSKRWIITCKPCYILRACRLPRSPRTFRSHSKRWIVASKS